MRIKPHSYLKKLVCLYVEDEPSIRKSFTLMLQSYFGKVIVAQNGKEGLELYEKERPDIIISDIRMPVMDGLEMVRHIKESDPDAIVIFVTAFSDVEYLKAALELGVEGYLTKPIDRNALLRKLNFLARSIEKEKESMVLLQVLEQIIEKVEEAIALIKDGVVLLTNRNFQHYFEDLDLLALEGLVDNKSFTYKEYEFSAKRIFLEDLEVLLIKNITDIQRIYIDELTGVYNRKIVEKILPKLLFSNRCFIFTDIDHFKRINDTYGHDVGDKVLHAFAQLLRHKLRKQDILIRWGGEEFVVILDGVEESEVAYKIAEFLRQEVEKLDIDGIKITSSFGVCCRTIDNREDFDKLIKCADEVLYEAKRRGRNRVMECSYSLE